MQQLELEHFNYWQVISSIIIHAYWASNEFTERLLQMRDIVILYFSINNYWYMCGGNNSITLNASALVNNDLFYGPTKTIRTTKMESGFSWRHKQKLLTDVFYQKHVGRLVFTRKIDENKQYHHEVIDGNSRLITLHEFFNNKITWNGKKYNQLSGKERITFSNYKIEIEFV